jgi:pyruvate dehydrogenase (quinone)
MAKQTIAEQYVDLMAHAGVRRMYGVVGDSLNPVVDAVRRHDDVEWIQVRHEEVAVFAAGAEASSIGARGDRTRPARSRPPRP